MALLDRTRPFTTAQARAAGITPGMLKGPAFRRVYRGVYLDARIALTPLTRVDAALLIHPSLAFASHSSAARIYGVPLPEGMAEEHISVFENADRRRRSGIRNHVADPDDAAVDIVEGRRCSAPARMFVELAGELGLVDLVVVGDYLVHRGLTTPEKLIAAAEAYTGDHAGTLRRAARYVRRDVDSAMETRLRMLIVLAGLPEPVVNFKVCYASGAVRYRFDLSYPDLKLIVEYDGRQHRDDLDQWDHDLERDDWLGRNGWKVVKVVARGIYVEPERTLARVREALGARGCQALPRMLSEQWRPFFPGKPHAAALTAQPV